MEKKFSSMQIATLRDVAKIVFPIREKRSVIIEKINALEREVEKLSQQIQIWEKPITETFGYVSTDLIKKERIGTRTAYTLCYPDTIVPPVASDCRVENIGVMCADHNPSESQINDDSKEEAREAFKENIKTLEEHFDEIPANPVEPDRGPEVEIDTHPFENENESEGECQESSEEILQTPFDNNNSQEETKKEDDASQSRTGVSPSELLEHREEGASEEEIFY